MKNKWTWMNGVFSLSLLLGFSAGAWGDLIAYEGFRYPEGKLLGQGASNSRGWIGAWGGLTNENAAQVVTRSMAYANGEIAIDNSGSGKALRTSQIGHNNLATRRYRVVEPVAELFVSALFQVETPSGSNTWWNQLWLNDVDTEPSASMISHAGGTIGARAGGTSSWSSGSPVVNTREGAVWFLVMRLSKSDPEEGNFDRVDVYINPRSKTDFTALRVQTATADMGKALMDYLGFRVNSVNDGYAGSKQYWSEIRVGTTWASVVVPQPGGTVMVVADSGVPKNLGAAVAMIHPGRFLASLNRPVFSGLSHD